MEKMNSGSISIILIVIIIGAFFMIAINTGPHVTPFEDFGQISVSIAIVWVIVKVIKGIVKARRGY